MKADKGTVRVALVAGPMYERLYEELREFTRSRGIQVEIGFRGVHPELNAHLASLEDVPYHLVSTHTKYAPSQQRFLATLDDEVMDDFYPALVEMTRIDGHICSVPRNLDAKLLHYRTDLVERVPQTWDELTETARALSKNGRYGFVFTGMDSGLFGMFYELAEMGGARLFPEDKIPQLNNEGGTWALGIIRELYQSGSAPAAVVDWKFDEAYRCFALGHAAMICDWPGYYSAYGAPDSEVFGKFNVAQMPAGPPGIHKAYGGSHTFALTKRGAGEPAAWNLLRFLTASRQQLIEARGGSVPVRRSVMKQVGRGSPRWALLEQVIANDLLVPPGLTYYPDLEEIIWRTVQKAMTGEIGIETALTEMEKRMIARHREHDETRSQHAS